MTAYQLAEIVGEPYSTIDHWSELGLLRFRVKGRTRLYPREENVFRCKRIRKLQNERFLLSNMRSILDREARSIFKEEAAAIRE